MSLGTHLDTYQKIIPCVLAAMAVIFAVWTAVSRTSEGVLFHDELLEISEQGSTTVYSGELYGTPVTITSREENGTKLVDFSALGHYSAACRVEYPEGTITTEYGKTVPRILVIRDEEVLFSGGYDATADSSYTKYFGEDGSLDLLVSVGVSANGDPWHYFEFSASDIMRFSNEPVTSARGSWIWYFVMLFGSVLISLEIIFRDEIFYLSHFRTVRDPEPTEYFYSAHKIGSVIGVILAFVFYIKGIFTIV